MDSAKKLTMFTLTAIALTACDNPVEKAASLTSGYVQETVLDSVKSGALSDDVKKNYLKVIKSGVEDLEAMNDPDLDSVHKVINEHLKDNDLSMYDYNVIMTVINKHKSIINKQNSNHQNDVMNFKDSI